MFHLLLNYSLPELAPQRPHATESHNLSPEHKEWKKPFLLTHFYNGDLFLHLFFWEPIDGKEIPSLFQLMEVVCYSSSASKSLAQGM